jgi:hypothetical protein
MRKVSKYQTSDGQMFNTVKEAKAHELNLVCQAVEVVTNPLLGQRLTRSDQVRFINALFPTHEEAKALIKMMYEVVFYDDEPEDEQ